MNTSIINTITIIKSEYEKLKKEHTELKQKYDELYADHMVLQSKYDELEKKDLEYIEDLSDSLKETEEKKQCQLS